ncbi:MAG: copper-translocating P-type ATPase [Gammaproteobacteria bacterium]|nr:copper-translocating P-type ATPase [Gammaproteobacteria bacterium]
MANISNSPASAQHFTLVHQLRRRIRIVAPTLRRDLERTYAAEILLRKHKAVRRVRVVPDLGSLAIEFDPKLLPREKLLQMLDRLIGNLGSGPGSSAAASQAFDLSGPSHDYTMGLDGMTCASCALLVEMMLRRDPRIEQATVNFATETAAVRGKLSKDALVSLIDRWGYTAMPLGSLAQRKLMLEREERRLVEARRRFFWSSVLSAPAIAIGMAMPHGRIFHWLELALTAPVVCWAAAPFFAKAWKLAKQRSANMDTLVALGSGAAYGYSVIALLTRQRELYFEAAAGIVTFVLLGRYLEEKARGRAQQAIRSLIDLQPLTANVLRDGVEYNVPIDEVVVGDVLLVRPGEKVPTDGTVVEGLSTVNEAMVTGESLPVVKEPGHAVIGGCVNGAGAMKIRVTAIGADTVLAGIVNMVDHAQATKLPIQKTVDRVSAVFVPSVMVFSGLTLAGWLATGASVSTAFSHAVAVLLIACPCALGLATPAAIMVGTGQAARRGVFIRNGETLETASRLNVVIFDKTGTITEGQPRVVDLINQSSLSDRELLAIAASAESNSEHFLGQAVVAYAREQGAPVYEAKDFAAVPGRGIRAKVKRREVFLGNAAWLAEQGISLESWESVAESLAGAGKTPVYCALNGQAVAVFGIADRARDNAPEAIAQLRRMGVRTLLVTGDVSAAAHYIANWVGIDEVVAHARPERKLEIVRELQGEGALVGMIGDGINDAPALAAADVGFAIGSGTDIAMETADMTLVHGDITKVAEAMSLSRDTLRIIHQNLFWAFAYNTVAIPVAAFGRLSPMIASAAMALSSVSVVVNSLRLQRRH